MTDYDIPDFSCVHSCDNHNDCRDCTPCVICQDCTLLDNEGVCKVCQPKEERRPSGG